MTTIKGITKKPPEFNLGNPDKARGIRMVRVTPKLPLIKAGMNPNLVAPT